MSVDGPLERAQALTRSHAAGNKALRFIATGGWGAFQFAEVEVARPGQAGSTWGRKRTTIGVGGCCRNSGAEVSIPSSRVARGVKMGKRMWTDAAQQL